MAELTMTFRVQIYCECGTPLEQITLPNASGQGWLTVKRCPACSQAKRIDEALDRERLMEIGSAGKINRRGVMVDERST